MARAREEYNADPANFARNHTHHNDAVTAEAMRRMVGFRHVAVHEHQALVLPITVNIIAHHLDDFLRYSQALLTGESLKF